MTDDRLKTGFETPDGLREFNAKWASLIALPEEIWPLSRRIFEVMLPGSRAPSLIQSNDDVIEQARSPTVA